MFVRAEVTVDPDIFDAIAETARASPKAMDREFQRQVKGLELDMLAELEIEPQPASDFYPLPWDSDKQRGYVMAKLRREGGLPHRRGRGPDSVLSSYRILFRPKDGTLIAENTSPHARWTVGDDARPMFLKIGWVQFAPVIAKYRPIANDRAIDAWAKVSMPKSRRKAGL